VGYLVRYQYYIPVHTTMLGAQPLSHDMGVGGSRCTTLEKGGVRARTMGQLRGVFPLNVSGTGRTLEGPM